MNRSAAGVVFCILSTLLLISQYLCAAIWSAGSSKHSPGSFSYILECIGPLLPTASAVCLAVGIFYLVAAEIMDIRHKKS